MVQRMGAAMDMDLLRQWLSVLHTPTVVMGTVIRVTMAIMVTAITVMGITVMGITVMAIIITAIMVMAITATTTKTFQAPRKAGS